MFQLDVCYHEMHITSLSLSVLLVSTMSAVLSILVINLPGKISPSLHCTLTGLLPPLSPYSQDVCFWAVKECPSFLITLVRKITLMYSWRGIQSPFAGGNIRMEVGNSKDVWFKSCTDLVMSRFFPLDFLPLAITGMQVLKVTRIHNRFLQDRFERILEAQVSWQSHSRWSNCYTSYSTNLRDHSRWWYFLSWSCTSASMKESLYTEHDQLPH